MVRSAFGVLSWKNRYLNDGIAIDSRISTGISVQATSSSVLWVVRDGTGLARALNLTITATSNASTNRVMTVMMIRSRLWKDVILSITSVADSCSLYSHGAG